MTATNRGPTRAPLTALLYRFVRFCVRLIARPTVTGEDNYPDPDKYEVVYVLQQKTLTDLAVLELLCADNQFTSPFETLKSEDFAEPGRFFSLMRSSAGRITMMEHSKRLQRFIESPDTLRRNVLLVPVSVFWGRAMSGQGSMFKVLTSENWAVTGRFKRVLNLLINRRNIYLHLGQPVALGEVAPSDLPATLAVRRTARLLRVRFRNQKVMALGPDFSHRRTLVEQVVNSRAVKQAIQTQVEQITDASKSANKARVRAKAQNRVTKLARKHATTIASDMSHPTIRILSSMLRWFWTKIYDGLNVRGIEVLEAVNATHTLVYVPSHRSHIDYLLLSYLLYHRGFMIPHIVAGDNLNQPILGSILRRGGAMFMRRSFRDDELYATVFSEYLYFVYRRGHCVEFFPEGGRTRTGRLLPAKYGLLKIALDHQRRGLPKPIAFVPVYCGYEKVVEGSSYLSELRGGAKKEESMTDVFKNLKLIRQNFGSVDVNFGEPIKLDEWLNTNPEEETVAALGQEIMQGINGAATLNPVNLVALVTLGTANSVIEERELTRQITLYQELIDHLYQGRRVEATELSPLEIIQRVESLGLLTRYSEEYGEVLGHEPFAAVLMTWYRNNVIHTLAMPALVACLLINRRRPLSVKAMRDMVNQVYPFLAQELSIPESFVDLGQCVQAMLDLKLIQLSKNGEYFIPLIPEDTQHYQLNLLAHLVSQTLERMFIVIHQLTQHTHTRESLGHASQLVAQKISRFYGINAPEFSDKTLFNRFIDKLIESGAVGESADGTLELSDIIEPVMRMARYVIDVKIRYGVSNAISVQVPADPT